MQSDIDDEELSLSSSQGLALDEPVLLSACLIGPLVTDLLATTKLLRLEILLLLA
jgi:hypothetical protein